MARETEHIKKCRSCGAPIVFLRTSKNNLIPVDADTVERDDYQFDRDKHTAHFATCDDPGRFRSRDR